jgi:hypothetical protein
MQGEDSTSHPLSVLRGSPSRASWDST